jgi:hypothetical protein
MLAMAMRTSAMSRANSLAVPIASMTAALLLWLPVADAAPAGSSWVVQSGPDAGSGANRLEGVAVISSTDVWAAGTYNEFGDNHGTVLLEHWNGSTWKVVPGVNPGLQSNELYAVAATASDDVWAAGEYDDVGAQCPQPTLIEHWNGKHWTVVSSPNPLPCNNLFGGAAISADDAWAVGQTFDDVTAMPLALHWDGTSWIEQDQGLPDHGIGFDSISADAPNDVWAVGDIIARWNGSTWEVLGTLPQNGTTRGIAAIAPDDVWVVGTQLVGRRALTLTEHWDGTSWTIVPSPNETSNGSDKLMSVPHSVPTTYGRSVTGPRTAWEGRS